MRDILERKIAEEQLQKYALELARSNRELQNFAYISSHDLQEPLRKIETFADRIQQRYADKLDERGQDYLARMQNAAVRMRTLIIDLLAFSRVTTQARPFTPVNLNKVVAGVWADLETVVEAVQGEVAALDLPTIDADEMQMRQLLQNLISNGLKFYKPGERPSLTISAQLLPAQEDDKQMVEISVADNGIGFEEKYLDRIFEVFQRLHGREAYEGTGIGLAVCRKIVERHQGCITARSQPGEGATFIVQLPLKQEVPPFQKGETSTHDSKRSGGYRDPKGFTPENTVVLDVKTLRV